MNKTLKKIAITGASTVLGATAALSLSIPAQAATVNGIPGLAQDFNVFLFENMESDSDAHGRVAVGGNATLTGFGMGHKLPTNFEGDTLVVGGNLDYEGQVDVGDVVVGGDVISAPTIVNGTLKLEKPSINFAEAEQFYKNYSTQLGNLATNGTVENKDTTLNLNGVRSDLNVFELDVSDLANATGLNIRFNQNSTVLVNITGTPFNRTSGFQTWLNDDSSGKGANRVLFNFVDATNLSSKHFSWQGSVLAPLADYNEFSSGHINGQLIAKSVTGTSGQFHIVAPNNGDSSVIFDGNLPDPEPVPEPLTILGSGMALGFGAFFKRQQSKKQKNAKQ